MQFNTKSRIIKTTIYTKGGTIWEIIIVNVKDVSMLIQLKEMVISGIVSIIKLMKTQMK